MTAKKAPPRKKKKSAQGQSKKLSHKLLFAKQMTHAAVPEPTPADLTGHDVLGHALAVVIVRACADTSPLNLPRTLAELGVNGNSFQVCVFNRVTKALTKTPGVWGDSCHSGISPHPLPWPCWSHRLPTLCPAFLPLPSPSFLFSKSFPCHTSENSPVSPVIATLPKTHVSNPFACHTSEPPGSVVPRYRNAPAFHLTQWLSTRRNLCRRVNLEKMVPRFPR